MEARNRRRILVLAGVVALAVVAGAEAAAPGPTAQIRGTIDDVIATLKRPDLKPHARTGERRELLRRQIQSAFDFEEMSKRSLGPEWRGRTPEEREEFTALFTQLLENAYLGKIESYRGETIKYVNEKIDPPYAVVHTEIVTSRAQQIPVDYRMLQKGDQWRIYDVIIEGVSLVNNYRSQFAGILQRSSFSQMMDKLRGTIHKQES